MTDPKKRRDAIIDAAMNLRMASVAYCEALIRGTAGEKAATGEALEQAAIAFGEAYNGPEPGGKD
jgi:hypothetical protein